MHPDTIFAQLAETFIPEIEHNFSSFLQQHSCDRWIIAADFVIGDSTRINDVFAFSIFPNPPIPFEVWIKTLRLYLLADFKKLKEINPVNLSMIRNADCFSFCFVFDRNRQVNQNKGELLATIDRTLEMMEGWHNADKFPDMIAKFRNLRQEAKAKKFNIKLLIDTVIFTSLTGFIAYLIAKHSYPKLIAAFPDRDKMTSSLKSIWESMFRANFGALCLTHEIANSESIDLGIGQREIVKDGDWYDVMTRTPDYLAGAIAIWDLEKNTLDSSSPKVKQIIDNVISDNIRVAIIKIRFSGNDMATSRVIVRRNKTIAPANCAS